MKNIFLQLSVVAILIFTNGCQNKEDLHEIQSSKNSQKSPLIKNENGILSFENKVEFNRALTDIAQMNLEELNNWYENLNFISLNQIFEEVNNAEMKINDFYEQMTPEELEASDFDPNQPKISEEYQNALKNGIIIEISESDGSKSYELNTLETDLAVLLNAERMVIIDDTLYTYSIDGYSMRSIRSSENTFISYKMSDNNSGRLNDLVYYTWQWSSRNANGWDTHGRDRYRVWIEGSSGNNSSEYYITNILRAQYQWKNIWGNWKYNGSKQFSISSGYFSYWYQDNINNAVHTAYTFPLSSEISPVYESPVNFNNYVNNLTIKLFPHITGYYSCNNCWNVESLYLTQSDVENITVYFGPYIYTLNYGYIN